MIQKEVFSERLKAAMKKQNLKQIDLVRAAQVQGIKLGKSHVSQYVSGKTVPRTDILLFLAKTLQVEEEWLIGVSNVESDTEISASNRNILDTNKTILGNSNKENSEALTMSAKRQKSSIFEAEIISDINKNIQTTSAATISRNISNKEGKKMREFKKSSKLDNVLYDVRGPVVDEATRMEEAGTHVLKLNIGNPAPFGFRTPDEVIYDMRQQLTDCEGYSNAMGLFSARKAIMQYCQLKKIPGVTMDDIYTGNGVSELINLSMQALLNDGDEILIPAPDYPLWTATATLAGGKVVHYICDEESDWNPDIADIRSKITDKTKAIVIINPNNPTGALYSKEILEEIVKVAEEFGLIIFSDEIYDRLVMDGLKHISIASIAPKNVFCVTFSGLSKSHMIAGFRVGWMVLSGNKKAAAGYIEGIKMLSNMRLCSNVPAQSIIQTALGGYQSVEEYLQPGGRIYEQREVIYKLLNDIPGVSAKKPKAAFYIFPKLDVEKFNIYDDEKFALDLLREKRILIVHGGGFNWGQPDHFRVVYLPRIADLEKATKKLGEFLDGYHQK